MRDFTEEEIFRKFFDFLEEIYYRKSFRQEFRFAPLLKDLKRSLKVVWNHTFSRIFRG
jgi:hypothetical protein